MTPTFAKFQILVADKEGTNLDTLRAAIVDALNDVEVIVMDIDLGEEGVLYGCDSGERLL